MFVSANGLGFGLRKGCKTVYTSSILVVASTPNQLILQIYFIRRRFRPGSMIPDRKWLPASWRILKNRSGEAVARVAIRRCFRLSLA